MQSQTGDLIYRRANCHNLQLALDIQHQTWPKEPVEEYYIAKADDPDGEDNVSWLVYHGDDLIGLTGVFTFDADEPAYDDGESIWMDWFTILPEFRRHGFGKQVLLDTIEYCRHLEKYKYFRIDTTYYPGRPALALYDQVLDLREEYTAEDTPEKKQYYLVYSYSLDGSPVKPWHNRLLLLGDNPEANEIR